MGIACIAYSKPLGLKKHPKPSAVIIKLLTLSYQPREDGCIDETIEDNVTLAFQNLTWLIGCITGD